MSKKFRIEKTTKGNTETVTIIMLKDSVQKTESTKKPKSSNKSFN